MMICLRSLQQLPVISLCLFFVFSITLPADYDSLGKLKKVAVYEFRSNTFIRYTDFYYWQDRLIKMRHQINGPGEVLGIAYYVFKSDKLIDSLTVLMKRFTADAVLNRANAYKRRLC